MAPERFDTDSFVIRSYAPGDGAALQRAVTASYEHLRAWMPWAKPDQTVEESEAVCRRASDAALANLVETLRRGVRASGGTGAAGASG